MLGVDCGKRFIKLVALRPFRGQWQLQACIAHEVIAAAGCDPAQQLQLALKSALQLLPPEFRQQPPRAGMALPTSELLIKSIVLPAALAHDDLELVIQMELGQAGAPEPELLSVDYRRCGDQVLAVACPTSVLNKSTAVLLEAGVRPALVSADALVIADSLELGQCGSQHELLVDAGATGIRLIAMRSGLPVYNRRHEMADNSCYASDPAAWMLLLRRAIQQYRLFDMLTKPDALTVYGGLAALGCVQDTLQQSFGVPAPGINPFTALNIVDEHQLAGRSKLHVSAFTLACALATQDASCE